MNDNRAPHLGSYTIALLGVMFVGLKLQHTIDWSWWWVTCPFWGPFALVILYGIVATLGSITE